MAIAFIALGSNLGDRRAHLLAAVAALRRHPRIRVSRLSEFFETAPVGKTDQPSFLNAAAEVETDLPPRDLLTVLLDTESRLGRVRTERWGSRTIDLDLLLYDALILDEPELQVPHPRMHERLFVLDPLAEIAPHVLHPRLKRTIMELRDGVRAESA